MEIEWLGFHGSLGVAVQIVHQGLEVLGELLDTLGVRGEHLNLQGFLNRGGIALIGREGTVKEGLQGLLFLVLLPFW